MARATCRAWCCGSAGIGPLLLGSVVRGDNAAISVDLTNPDIAKDGLLLIPRGTLHLSRLMVLSQGVLHDRIKVRNYGLAPIVVSIDIEFDADFVDLFEVRGTQRLERGLRHPAVVNGREVSLVYTGLDNVQRATRVGFESETIALSERRAHIEFELPPHGERQIGLSIRCENGVARAPRRVSGCACRRVADTLERRRANGCDILTSNQQFNDWLRRSSSDLSMMITDTRYGEYPYAGVPWFSTPFGRDGLITAFQCLWMNPSIARGVLSFLAATQATSDDPVRDAQRGKVLHEMRSGEMAALGEVPFGRYYGSHDATPLFVMLAASYLERTDDRAFIERIWPAIESALHWLEWDGDLDADGFIEYARQSPTGLVHQGWKDSHDSISHASGALADAPIALCEIQGYLYAAWHGAASLSASLGHAGRASEYIQKATTLRENFDKAFWNEPMGTYAIALDGHKRQCAVRASNAGHALFTGIAMPNRAARGRAGADVAGRLLGLGHPHAGHVRGAVQPDVVPQRIHLAARQFPDCGRLRPLRPARRSARGTWRPVRSHAAHGSAPAAGALLRLPARARRIAGVVSGGLLAAGVGLGSAVPAAAIRAWPGDSRRTAHREVHASAAAGVPARSAHQQPAHRPSLARHCPRAPRVRRRHRRGPPNRTD